LFRLTSLNLNGIRSAASKGLAAWVAATAPDCMGVQELKAQVVTPKGFYNSTKQLSPVELPESPEI
jgi:exodeoxyribonuclease-3